MTIQSSWNGRFFEDFQVGEIYPHSLGRTITATDNSWFTQLTQNTNPLHFNEHYATATPYGRTVVNSAFTIALITGQSVSELSQNVLANLGWDEVRLQNPVFEGDTLYSFSEIVQLRLCKSRNDVGIMDVKTTGYNDEGQIVITFKRTMMIYKKAFAPQPRQQLLQQVLQQRSE